MSSRQARSVLADFFASGESGAAGARRECWRAAARSAAPTARIRRGRIRSWPRRSRRPRRRRPGAAARGSCRSARRRARRRCASRSAAAAERARGRRRGRRRLICPNSSAGEHDDLRLLLQRKRVQRVARADDDVLAAVEQVGLRTVAVFAPRPACHSGLPVAGSYATKLPPPSLPNSSLPAVLSRPIGAAAAAARAHRQRTAPLHLAGLVVDRLQRRPRLPTLRSAAAQPCGRSSVSVR